MLAEHHPQHNGYDGEGGCEFLEASHAAGGAATAAGSTDSSTSCIA